MQKILAISGGIDSVSMLHMLRHDPAVVVAHFNHGIRENSDADEAFVRNLAASYQLPFISKTEKLGPHCSEAHARERRYKFLNALRVKHRGKIYTAHHQDDLVETIAINLLRGTRWRGLVPLDDPRIHRPLLGMTKNDIYQYATKHGLIFRHDSTNTEDHFLRNRVRNALINLDPKIKHQLLALYNQQKTLKPAIERTLQRILPDDDIYERNWFSNLDEAIAIEILRAGLLKSNHTVTYPQLLDLLAAVRTYATNKKFNLPGDNFITIRKTAFSLKPHR